MTKLFIFPLILIKKITFNCSRLNIAISPGYEDWVKSSSPSSKTEIIPLTKNHVTEKQKFFDGVINFSFVGTLGDTYDLEMIFNLEKFLYQRRINFQINICGDGPKAKYIQNRINTKNIVFHGWLAETELQSVLDHTHFGLMFYNKSSPQGWPNKLFEFMSNGIPIINTLKGESYKLIKEKKLGYNISSEFDIDSVLGKILNDIESKQYFEIVRNNYDTFKRNFSNDSGNRKLLSLIKKHLS
jgi:glycosyltransferase involved in cell wall biosynthesis